MGISNMPRKTAYCTFQGIARDQGNDYFEQIGLGTKIYILNITKNV